MDPETSEFRELLPAAKAGGKDALDTLPALITTERLFGGSREILLRHGKSVYRLRITSKDKLILTK